METYKNQIDEHYQEKIEALIHRLPPLAELYVTAHLRIRSRRTIESYLRKFTTFFAFLCDRHPEFCDKTPEQIEVEALDKIDTDFCNIFLNYMYDHQADNPAATNTNNTVEAYSSALNSLFKFLQKNGKIKGNPFANVERRHKKTENPAYLRGSENETFYQGVLDGVGMTKQQLAFREKHRTAYRDYLICRVLGSTGIRVSELVGLDIKDIDLVHAQFKVIRKGGKIQTIYMSDKLCTEMKKYIKEIRPEYDLKEVNVPEADKDALFVVAQGKYYGRRLTVRSIEDLIHKYALAQGLTDAARFHPHSLRHSMGMMALEKSQNLRLVQQILGHESITTTTLYSRMTEANLRDARNIGEY